MLAAKQVMSRPRRCDRLWKPSSPFTSVRVSGFEGCHPTRLSLRFLSLTELATRHCRCWLSYQQGDPEASRVLARVSECCRARLEQFTTSAPAGSAFGSSYQLYCIHARAPLP